jgi:hypothetical protein
MGNLRVTTSKIVEIFCDQAVTERRPIDIFGRDVSTIGESGRTLLARLASKGMRLHANGIHTSYVVRDLVAGCSKALDSPGGGASRTPASNILDPEMPASLRLLLKASPR